MIHPREFVTEELCYRGWSAETLAERSGLPLSVVREFLIFDWPMDQRLAEGLNRALGPSVGMWKRLDLQFQRGYAREDQKDRREEIRP